jgi:hypothetical protein
MDRWTPIALNVDKGESAIFWGDFGGIRFTEPFFENTVNRWAAADGASGRFVQTGPDVLRELDGAPSLDPAGFVFHMSRCGSTLIARLLKEVPGTVVVSEPEVVNQLLLAHSLSDELCVELLRLIVRALGRRRLGDERHYVFKVSSWGVRKFALFQRAFPSTPKIWVKREPAQVLASLLAKAPGWQQWHETPDIAAEVFDIPRERLAGLDTAQFYAAALSAMLASAQAHRAQFASVIDYRDLPQAAWLTAAKRFDLPCGVPEIARMQVEAQYYSKDSTPRVFESHVLRDIPAAVRALAAEQLDGLYRAFNQRPISAPGLPGSGDERS